MQYSRWGDWSYNQEANTSSSTNKICSVYNNEGKQKILKSITLYLAIAKSGTTANWGDKVSGNGGSVNISLSTSGTSLQNSSTSVTVDGPLRGTYYNSAKTKKTYYTNSCTQYTFTFSNGITMDSGATINFYYYRNWGTNVLICPKDGQYWDGTAYTTQNVTGYAVDAYSEPSVYNITDYTKAGMKEYTEFSMTYQITTGTGGRIHWVDREIYPSSVTWSYGKYANVSDSVKNAKLSNTRILAAQDSGYDDGTRTNKFTINSSAFKDGTKYRLAIHFSDMNYEWLSGDGKVFYTYKKPTMSLSGPSSTVSPQDNGKITWTTNDLGDSNYESSFTTSGTCNGTSISGLASGTSGTITLNNTFLNKYYTAAQRSVATLSGSVSLTRRNPSAGSKYDATASQSFKIQYRPDKTPGGGNVTDGSNSVKNTTIIAQNTPKIYVDWTYGFTGSSAGVANGYILRVYSDSNYTTQVGSDYDISVSTAGSSASKTLDTKTQLKRGVMNYATITPYYTKPDGTGKIEGTSPLKIALCKVISKIESPIIEYPQSGTTWHNKYFRVLFKMSTDDDLDCLISDGTISSKTDYQYQDVQIKITPNSKSDVTYSSSTTSIWSKTISNIGYNEKVAVCPALSSLDDATSYTIAIRVRKKYYNLSETNSWSEWTTVTLNKTAVNRETFTVGAEIKASHYQYMQQASVRLQKVYPFKSVDSENVSQSSGDQIDYSEYNGIYNTLVAIKDGINDYCTYSNANVKLQNAMTTISPKVTEFITAEDVDEDTGGRNYINIMIDNMNTMY